MVDNEVILKNLVLEEVSFDALEELEEVITPGSGTIFCCVD